MRRRYKKCSMYQTLFIGLRLVDCTVPTSTSESAVVSAATMMQAAPSLLLQVVTNGHFLLKRVSGKRKGCEMQIMRWATVLIIGSTVYLAGCLETLNKELAVSAGLDLVKAATVTDSQMVALANQSIGQYDGQSKVAGPDDAYTKRLNRLFGPYRNAAQVPLEYKVYYDDTLNAFAMPNGSIRVHTALMDLLEDDELLGVIGHEIGHVVEEHSLGRYKRAYQTLGGRKLIAATTGTAGQIAASDLGALSQTFLTSKFSRENELSADAFGVKLLKESNRDPRALIRAFEKMRRVHGDGGGMFASHPSNSARIEAIERAVNAS